MLQDRICSVKKNKVLEYHVLDELIQLNNCLGSRYSPVYAQDTKFINIVTIISMNLISIFLVGFLKSHITICNGIKEFLLFRFRCIFIQVWSRKQNKCQLSNSLFVRQKSGAFQLRPTTRSTTIAEIAVPLT